MLAADGETALRRIDEERPDLVVLDIMMPVLDGWFVLAELARPRRASVRRGVLGEVERQRPQPGQGALGADEYVTKPFEPDDLVARHPRRAQPPRRRSPRLTRRPSKPRRAPHDAVAPVTCGSARVRANSARHQDPTCIGRPAAGRVTPL